MSSLLSPPTHLFAVILSPGALRVKCVDGSDGSRAVTSLWRLPSCFAAMLFCDDTVTRGAPSCFDYQTALWGKVKDQSSPTFCTDTIAS